MGLIDTQHNEVYKRLMKAVHWKQTRLKPEISGGPVWQNCSWFTLSCLPKDKVGGYSNGSVALINIAINCSLEATLQDSELKAQKERHLCMREKRKKKGFLLQDKHKLLLRTSASSEGKWCNISHIKTDFEVNSVKQFTRPLLVL